MGYDKGRAFAYGEYPFVYLEKLTSLFSLLLRIKWVLIWNVVRSRLLRPVCPLRGNCPGQVNGENEMRKFKIPSARIRCNWAAQFPENRTRRKGALSCKWTAAAVKKNKIYIAKEQKGCGKRLQGCGSVLYALLLFFQLRLTCPCSHLEFVSWTKSSWKLRICCELQMGCHGSSSSRPVQSFA